MTVDPATRAVGGMGRQDRFGTDTVDDMTSVDASKGLPMLGKLELLDVRQVWKHEAHTFTPWLLANADVLGELLGMDLVLSSAEHPVGGFSLDLIGVNETTNETVIIENQLTKTDHGHLGQLLTCAGGTDPVNVVWIATEFREEHRAALDWLNGRTDGNTRFFGIEISAVRIGESVPAPLMRLVAQPNNWGKKVKAIAKGDTAASDRAMAYQEFWKPSATPRAPRSVWHWAAALLRRSRGSPGPPPSQPSRSWSSPPTLTRSAAWVPAPHCGRSAATASLRWRRAPGCSAPVTPDPVGSAGVQPHRPSCPSQSGCDSRYSALPWPIACPSTIWESG